MEDEWISVEDDMPADFVDVLVYGADNLETYEIAWQESDDPHWYETGGNQNPIRYVTHWQPLPKPPNVQKIDK